MVVGLVKWGNRPPIRFAFAIISVAAGVTLGWMVSQDQLIGWSRNGLNARALLPLLVLTIVALVVPAYTGKNIYCNRICPHGAAQSLLGHVVKKRFALPPKLHHVMRRVPWLTLLVIWAIAFPPLVFPFSHIEPFESWSSGSRCSANGTRDPISPASTAASRPPPISLAFWQRRRRSKPPAAEPSIIISLKKSTPPVSARRERALIYPRLAKASQWTAWTNG